MSFLTPLYLLGALGLAIPIILHLLHDRPKNKQEFGSLMFLDKTKPPVDRKRRPTHLLLLLLRCLALLLLAFVFARPFVTVDDPADAARRDRQWITVLLDRSASMQRADLWAQAKAGVQTTLGQLGPGDRFTLIAYDDSTELLAEVQSWLGSSSGAEVNAQLERLAKPGFGGSNLGQALVLAGELIDGDEPGADELEADEQPLARREIIVISDLQKGSRLDDMQGYEWPTGIKVRLEQIGEDDQGNAGIEQVASRSPWAAVEAVPSFRISNSANGIGDELEFLAHTTAGETLSQKVHVPPGRSRVIELPGEWAGKSVERLAIRGDAAEFDNQFHFAQNRQQTVRIVYVGEDKPNNAEGTLFYLASAFHQSSTLDFQVEAVSGKSTGPLPEADLFVIGDAVDDPLAQALDQAIGGGATVLMIVQSPGQTANLGQWLGADGVVIRDIASSDYALLQSLKLDHPVLAVFRDARFSDFTNLHFWKHRELQNLPDEGIDVLARFDSGAPAWLAARRGDGRLLVMNSGWTPVDSQLALSTKFIPLLYSILQPVLEGKTQSRQFVVGSEVDVTRFNNGQVGGDVTVIPPGDGATAISVDKFFTPATPGLHTAKGSDWSETFAVNLTVAESRTEPIVMDQFKKLGLPMTDPVASPGEISAAVAAEKTEAHRREYWQWALAAVLLFVTLETVLAARGSRPAEPVMIT
ncbi:MAG: BatA domain-containing protein [Verrucomicrobiota bacterium]|nr:BatA domain-containing protein [Verrucomicrobiota bacterium]MDP7049039.1 BatA domain-containing protein [Verrucomicrobiota bacterium]